MDPDIHDLIRLIHAVARKSALVITGGGVTAAGWLLAVPGGSRTILEVAIPYASQALADYLAHEPASYCSAAVTREMALRARDRAILLAPGEPVIGVGCTASLRSDRPKRGEHRVHVAVATEAGTIVQSLILAKEQRERESEEAIVARLVLNALAEGFGLAQRVTLPLLPGETVQREERPAGLLARFLTGQPAVLCVEPDGRLREGGVPPGVLLPGSFNPLHEGHRGMAAAAAKALGRPAAFELSVANAEKPTLVEAEVRRRMAQFAWLAPVWLAHAPTFLEKSRLFPGVVFVVGIDTAVRIVEPRFYGNSVEAMRAALAEIRRHGARFLVAGRLVGEKFVELGEAQMPEEFRDLFTAIPAEVFRADVSSTQLRGERSFV